MCQTGSRLRARRFFSNFQAPVRLLAISRGRYRQKLMPFGADPGSAGVQTMG